MIGSQTCLGMMAIFDKVEVRNELCGAFSVNRSVFGSTIATLSILTTLGKNCGALPGVCGISNEYCTSSAVTGMPSWNFMPSRSTTSSVVGSSQVAEVQAQLMGLPWMSTRTR